MRRGAMVLLVAALGWPPCKLRAQPPAAVEGPPPAVLVVDRPVAWRPPALPVSVVCDDPSVVRVEDAGTFLRLVGLRPGDTSCSFGSALRPGRRQLYRFTVLAGKQ